MNNVFIKFDGGWIHAKSHQLSLVDEVTEYFSRKTHKETQRECVGIILKDYSYADLIFIQTDRIQEIRTWKWNTEKLSMLGHHTLDEILIWQKEGAKASPKWSFWQKLKFLFSKT